MDFSFPFGVRKGAWSVEEDRLLRKCIQGFGEGKWNQVPLRAGLNRCRKSCRLRWLNYLNPDIKRGSFSADEVDLMLRLHRLLGNRWSLIAGRIPGRTANDVKNYWNTHLQKKSTCSKEARSKNQKNVMEVVKVIKPKPRVFSKEFPWLKTKTYTNDDPTIPEEDNLIHKPPPPSAQIPQPPPPPPTVEINNNPFHETNRDLQDHVPWWDDMVLDDGNTWWSSAEPNKEDATTTLGIEAAVESSFQDSQTRDWADDFIEDNLQIWDLLRDEQYHIV